MRLVMLTALLATQAAAISFCQEREPATTGKEEQKEVKDEKTTATTNPAVDPYLDETKDQKDWQMPDRVKKADETSAGTPQSTVKDKTDDTKNSADTDATTTGSVEGDSDAEEVPTVPRGTQPGMWRPRIEEGVVDPRIQDGWREAMRRRGVPSEYMMRGPPPSMTIRPIDRDDSVDSDDEDGRRDQRPQYNYMPTHVPYQYMQYHPGMMYGGHPMYMRGGQRSVRPMMQHYPGGYVMVPSRYMGGGGMGDMLRNIEDDEVNFVRDMARQKIDSRRGWHQMNNGELERFERQVGMCPAGQEPEAKGWERGEEQDIVDENGKKIGHEVQKQVVMRFDSRSDCKKPGETPESKPALTDEKKDVTTETKPGAVKEMDTKPVSRPDMTTEPVTQS